MLTCQFGADYVTAGGMATVLIRSSNIQGRHFADYKLFAQVHGHVSVENRWMTQSFILKSHYHQVSTFFHEDHVPLPKTTDNSVCIYVTPAVQLPQALLEHDSDVFLHFDIPFDAIPTHRGVCSSVQYSITITVVFGSKSSTLSFPFTVCGSGSNAVPYYTRYIHNSLMHSLYMYMYMLTSRAMWTDAAQ